MLRFWALFFAIVTCLTACSQDSPEPPGGAVDADALRAHVNALQAEDMQGLQAGTQGYDKAAVYVAEQFSKAGLEPAGVDGSYFQPIGFRHLRILPETAQLLVQTKDDSVLRLQYGQSYAYFLNPQHPMLDITAELVFAGYGLTRYDDLDMQGKIAVVLSGALDGQTGAGLSLIDNKAADAARAGAIGLIVVPMGDEGDVAAFTAQSARAQQEQSFWTHEDGKPFSPIGALQIMAHMAPDKAYLLFEKASQSYAKVLEQAAQGKTISPFDMGMSVTIRASAAERVSVSSNVLGRLPRQATGDVAATKPAQTVLLLTQLAANQEGDNALGVAALLEVAKAMAAVDEPWQRDIVFAALTAQGNKALGAQFLADQWPETQGTVAAALALDVPLAPFSGLVAAGGPHSTLGSLSTQIANRSGIEIKPDWDMRPEAYAFAQRGVPSMSLAAIPEAPSDMPVDWDKATSLAQVQLDMMRTLASTQQSLVWSEGSVFSSRP
ncbi:MAG: M28 family peptidase [Pseudomonadota bacterium]